MVIPASTKFSRSLSDLRTLNIKKHERIMDYDEFPLINLANRTPNPTEEVLFVVKLRPAEIPVRRTRHASLSSATALSVGYADPQRLIQRSPLIVRMQNQFAVKPCLVQLNSGNF
ncbi:unnamed protein product [Gongylonema pulchrum]|uniref:MSP domain-containing protein n=1 Tax=Gongylonema pulchrum TaxID=637853 RepID=A0A183EQ71_9BILA|nr:unnamed protein product [Gongylonema pulchrum]